MQLKAAAVLVALGISAGTWLHGVELTVAGTSLCVKTDAVQATGDFATGRITFSAAGTEFSGQGKLLAVREDGLVSDLLAGGASRQLGGGDTFAVQFGARTGPALVALVNPSGGSGVSRIPFKALGLTGAVCAAYDFSSNGFVGPIAARLSRPLEAGQIAIMALAEAAAHPVVLATSTMLRDPNSASASWDERADTLSGSADLEVGEACEVRILAPPEPVRWLAKSASANGGEATQAQTGEWLRLTLKSAAAGRVSWSVVFARAAPVAVAGRNVAFTASPASPRCALLASDEHGMNVVVRRDDGVELAMSGPSVSDTSVLPEQSYTYTLCAVDWSGRSRTVAEATVKMPARPPPPPLPEVFLSDLDPVKATNGWNGAPRRDKSIEDNPIRIRGEVFKRGMGVHAFSELVYTVKPEHRRFVSIVGVDDEKGGAGSVRFTVYADERQLLQTPALTGYDDRFCVDLEIPEGTKQMRLLVDDAGNGVGCDHADWANAGFLTAK